MKNGDAMKITNVNIAVTDLFKKGINQNELERIQNIPWFQLVTKGLFIAECKEAGRDAFSNALVFIGSIKHGKKYANFKKSDKDNDKDNDFCRLNYFRVLNGDENKVLQIKALLRLGQICNWWRDREKDIKNGKDNPFNLGYLKEDDYFHIKQKQERVIKAINDPEINAIITPEKAVLSFWS